VGDADPELGPRRHEDPRRTREQGGQQDEHRDEGESPLTRGPTVPENADFSPPPLVWGPPSPISDPALNFLSSDERWPFCAHGLLFATDREPQVMVSSVEATSEKLRKILA
jgi:hypothetical protein